MHIKLWKAWLWHIRSLGLCKNGWLLDQRIIYSSVASSNTPSNLHKHKVSECQELREVDTRLRVFHGWINLGEFGWLVCIFFEVPITPQKSFSKGAPISGKFLGVLTEMKRKTLMTLVACEGWFQDTSAPFIPIRNIKYPPDCACGFQRPQGQVNRWEGGIICEKPESNESPFAWWCNATCSWGGIKEKPTGSSTRPGSRRER